MFKLKLKKIRDAIKSKGFDAAVIGLRENLNWLTGHDPGVCLTVANAPIILIVTKDGGYLVGATMDALRFFKEDIEEETTIELCQVLWFEQTPFEKAGKIIESLKVISDFPIGNAVCDGEFFTQLHYPLFDEEIELYKSFAKKAEEIMFDIANQIKPGMTEEEVRWMFSKAYSENEIDGLVYIIGSDERIANYRHCIAKNKVIDRLIMLAPACRKYGLTVPITRMIYFGDNLPKETLNKFEVACKIEAQTIDMAREGTKFNDIFLKQKEMFKEYGYENEWKNHFQGGMTGYVVNDSSLTLDTNAVIKDNQTFNWYITLTGVKVEETMLTSKKHGQLILSENGIWPTKKYEVNNNSYELPQIMIK